MSKPFNIHDWQAKQRKQLLNEADGPISRGEGQKERLVKTIVNVFNGRLGNWYNDSPTNMNDVQALFDRDREAMERMVSSHLRDVTIDPRSDIGESNTTGIGSTITTGDSMAYATPKAFKKKNKED